MGALEIFVAESAAVEGIVVDGRIGAILVVGIGIRFGRSAVDVLAVDFDVILIVCAPDAFDAGGGCDFGTVALGGDGHAAAPVSVDDVVDGVVGVGVLEGGGAGDDDVGAGLLELGEGGGEVEECAQAGGGGFAPAVALCGGDCDAEPANGQCVGEPVSDGGAVDPVGDGVIEVVGAAGEFGQEEVVDEVDDDFAVGEFEFVGFDGEAVVSVGERTLPGAFEEIDGRAEAADLFGGEEHAAAVGVEVVAVASERAVVGGHAPVGGKAVIGAGAVEFDGTAFLDVEFADELHHADDVSELATEEADFAHGLVGSDDAVEVAEKFVLQAADAEYGVNDATGPSGESGFDGLDDEIVEHTAGVCGEIADGGDEFSDGA